MTEQASRREALDACIKCSVCTAMCPVTAANPLYSGPKSIGPDAERFRLEGIEIGTSLLSYCSECRTCELTCPSGVQITKMIARARRKALQNKKGNIKTMPLDVRDYILGRTEYLGELASLMPKLTNILIGASLARKAMESILGISSKAPLPGYGSKLQNINRKINSKKKQVVYFPGCFTKYNDSPTGKAIIKVLEYNGYEVIVPSFNCCATPLEANGRFKEAEDTKRKNLALMQPYAQQGIPLITGCTTCGLALKEYPSFEEEGFQKTPLKVYDLFEFLWMLYQKNELRTDFKEINTSLGYHASCHLKAQGIGVPAIRILRLIPGVKVVELDQGCCGLSGSYGFKKEKYNIAMQIGQALFNRASEGIRTGDFENIACECGVCRVQINHGAKVETNHPVWILMQAYGFCE